MKNLIIYLCTIFSSSLSWWYLQFVYVCVIVWATKLNPMVMHICIRKCKNMIVYRITITYITNLFDLFCALNIRYIASIQNYILIHSILCCLIKMCVYPKKIQAIVFFNLVIHEETLKACSWNWTSIDICKPR